MGTLHVFLFRDFAVTRDGRLWPGLEGRKVKELFCYLLLNRERPHRREALTALLWEEGNAAVAQKYFRQVLWQLQSGLADCVESPEEPILLADSEWIQINPCVPLWCDVTVFQTAIAQAQGSLGYYLKAAEVHDLQEAVDLYHGDLLEGWYLTWCLVERERLRNKYLMALDKLIDYCESHHLFEEGIDCCMRVLKQDCARERTHRRLMRLYALLGDRTGAIRQYKLCAEALKQELDILPGQQTQELYRCICHDDLPRAPAPSARAMGGQAEDLTELLAHLVQLQASSAEASQGLQRDIEIVSSVLVSKGFGLSASGLFLPPD